MSNVSKAVSKTESYVLNAKKYGHTIENFIKGKVFTTTIDTDKCLLCNDALYEFEVYSKKVQGTRLLNFK